MESLALLSIGLPFLIATVLGPVVIAYYKRKKWLDDPESASHAKVLHTKAVPRGGGIIIFAAILIASLFLLEVDRYLLHILAGGAVLMIVGVIDDIFDIHPLWRLIAGAIAGLIVVGAGIGIAYITNPFGPGVIHLDQPQLVFNFLGETRSLWILADLFAFFFIIWNMNIVNWSKGVDGQMPGFVAIAAIFVGVLSSQFLDDPTQFDTAHLSFIVAGAFLGLLVWNWYPQKMMPGYGAGSLAGYFLAVLAILSGAKVATTLMVLALPTADAVFTIARRIRAGKSPLWGDRGHLHHKLLDHLGWGRRRIAVFYWTVSAVMGMLSLALDTTGKLFALGITGLLVFGFMFWIKYDQVTSS